MLHGLRAEGAEPPVILWALSREIRLLYQCAIDIDKGQNQQRVLQSRRVWDKRKPIVSAGLARHSRDDLGELLHQASLVDHSIKVHLSLFETVEAGVNIRSSRRSRRRGGGG